jgi:hypothetical protein
MYIKIVIGIVLIGVASMLPAQAQAAESPSPAKRLAHVLDEMQVERLWPAGEHVDWRTGVPDGRPESGQGKHTHCSAFVAATAMKLGVYILRPPEHGQVLLANAQYEWLAGQGASRGWRELDDARSAQDYARRGYLVVATYRNHHDDKPGHIAIVRPDNKSDRELQSQGPQIIQAGGTNYTSTTLKRGFAGHPAAWTRNEVRYYAHAVDWSSLPAR